MNLEKNGSEQTNESLSTVLAIELFSKLLKADQERIIAQIEFLLSEQ